MIEDTEKYFFVGLLHYGLRVRIPKMEVLSRERAILQHPRKQGDKQPGVWGQRPREPARAAERRAWPRAQPQDGFQASWTGPNAARAPSPATGKLWGAQKE